EDAVDVVLHVPAGDLGDDVVPAGEAAVLRGGRAQAVPGRVVPVGVPAGLVVRRRAAPAAVGQVFGEVEFAVERVAVVPQRGDREVGFVDVVAVGAAVRRVGEADAAGVRAFEEPQLVLIELGVRGARRAAVGARGEL